MHCRLESALPHAPIPAHKGFCPSLWARLNFSQNTDGEERKRHGICSVAGGGLSMGTAESEDTVTLGCSLSGMQGWHGAVPGHGWGCCSVMPWPQQHTGASCTPTVRVLWCPLGAFMGGKGAGSSRQKPDSAARLRAGKTLGGVAGAMIHHVSVTRTGIFLNRE